MLEFNEPDSEAIGRDAHTEVSSTSADQQSSRKKE